MTHADAFLKDILAHPDDDAPRLIFADWLEEQGAAAGAARAELIRVQCALAGDLPPGSRRAQLEDREQRLLESHGAEWARLVRRLVREWVFRRGFVEEVSAAPWAFLAHAPKLFRRAPVQHVRLSGFKEDFPARDPSRFVPALAECKQLVHVRSLDLNHNQMDSTDVRALVVSPYLTRLTALNLGGNRIGDSGVRALATAPLMEQLTHLNLSDNDLGPESVRILAAAFEERARAGRVLPMRKLHLAFNRIGWVGRRALAVPPLRGIIADC